MKTRISIVTIFLVAIILASCAARTTPAPTATTNLPTATVAPTATTAPTVTPTQLIERPTHAEMASLLSDYSTVLTRNADKDKQKLFNDPEIIVNRLMEKSITGENGSLVKVLIDPETNTILFIKTRDPNTETWVWELSTMKNLGNALHLFIGSDSRITPNFFEQLNHATVGIYWNRLNPSEGVYDWKYANEQIDMLIKGGIPAENITLHGFIFGEDTNYWFVSKDPTPDELKEILVDYVTNIVKYGKSKGIKQYVLLSEPFFAMPDGTIYRHDYFYEKLGEEYYEIIYRTARSVDSDAYLILNDDGNHYDLFGPDGKVDLTSQASVTYNIAKKLCEIKVDGKPILNAVGFEMHNKDRDWIVGGIPAAENERKTLSDFKELGIDLIITEFDYDMSNFRGTNLEKEKRQAEVYERLLGTALELGVRQITFWDIEDTTSGWVTEVGIIDAMPTLFANGSPKLNYYEFLAILSDRILSNNQ